MMYARPLGADRVRLCLDLGYDYDEVRHIVHLAGFEPVILSRRNEQENMKQLGARGRRWVVERTHSWLNRIRRLLVRWEMREDTYSPCCSSRADSSLGNRPYRNRQYIKTTKWDDYAYEPSRYGN